MADSPVIFDRALLRRRHLRAMTLSPATFLLDRVAGDMADRVATVLRKFDIAVDLGTPGTAVRTALGQLQSVVRIVSADVEDSSEIIVDEKASSFGDATLNLVVSALALQF